MNKFFLLLLLILFANCSKPKAVLICGDHVCVNKKEANQYFKENLSLEMKIIGGKEKKIVNLVELNLQKDSKKEKINITKKTETNEVIKVLSPKEVKAIKKRVNQKVKKQKEGLKKISKRVKNKDSLKKTKKVINIDNISTDICTLLDKCSIDEISKYLIKQGKNKKFPDLTIRQ